MASGRRPTQDSEVQLLKALRASVRRARSTGLVGWKDEDLLAFPRLYRHACALVARLEATGEDPRRAAEARHWIALAHGVLYTDRHEQRLPWPVRLARYYFRTVPRAIRSEWKLTSLSLALMYGLAALAYYAVSRDLDLAPSLLSPEMVSTEIEQLRATEAGEPFRGNFTFGLGESPTTAGWLMLHNIGVSILFFGSALIPPLYLFILSTNALMLGTYTAVAGHWGQAGAISSILWCHGVLEIQAIVLSGTAGLVLVRGFVRPGPRTRRVALQLESKRALELLSAMFPMLVLAGLIEAFVSPHAPLPVRLSFAIGTGVLLFAWVLFSGRSAPARDALPRSRS